MEFKLNILYVPISAFKRYPKLFHYLCDLIVYEQFFRNVLLSDCLSEASCCSNEEKIVNDYTIRSIRNEITKILLDEIYGGRDSVKYCANTYILLKNIKHLFYWKIIDFYYSFKK